MDSTSDRPPQDRDCEARVRAAVGETMWSLLQTVIERGQLSRPEVFAAVEALDAERVDEEFWQHFGGPMADQLEDALLAVGERGVQAGERVWRMPLCAAGGLLRLLSYRV